MRLTDSHGSTRASFKLQQQLIRFNKRWECGERGTDTHTLTCRHTHDDLRSPVIVRDTRLFVIFAFFLGGGKKVGLQTGSGDIKEEVAPPNRGAGLFIFLLPLKGPSVGYNTQQKPQGVNPPGGWRDVGMTAKGEDDKDDKRVTSLNRTGNQFN